MVIVKRATGALLTSLALTATTSAAPGATDSCAKFAGQSFVVPSDALACLKSFPFNETLRQNVLTNIARVFDFFTFEEFYLNSPAPFQESTTNIRADIARINRTKFAVCFVNYLPLVTENAELLIPSYARPTMTSTELYMISPLNSTTVTHVR